MSDKAGAGTTQVDVVVIGAGAAGLMCAATAAYQDHRVLVLDHANKAGKKILMSGGGRCNFTNLNTRARGKSARAAILRGFGQRHSRHAADGM